MKLFTLLVLFSSLTFAKDIKVLEIDTGMGLNDTNGHGSHIAGIIMKDVCPEVNLISCIYYDKLNTDKQNFQNELECFKSALIIKPDIINFSSGGPDFNKEEYEILKSLSDLNIKIVVAAGNDGRNFLNVYDPVHSYFPAQYDIKNIIPVGNLDEYGNRNPSSNYGLSNMVWEVGTNILSNYLYGTYAKMSGTSQAAAARTNRILKGMCNEIH